MKPSFSDIQLRPATARLSRCAGWLQAGLGGIAVLCASGFWALSMSMMAGHSRARESGLRRTLQSGCGNDDGIIKNPVCRHDGQARSGA
eukprot:scaffold9792_cov121-Isochrysis_galbana.AAC.4